MPIEELESAGPTEQEAAEPQPFTSFLDDANDDTSTEQAESEELESAEAEAVEGETEDEDPNWLPTEQLKEFPNEVIARYAKRYGYTEDELSDPRIQRILKDKINSDIQIQKLSAEELESAEEGEEESEEEPTLEATNQPDAQQLEQAVSQFVDQVTHPEVAKKWFTEVNSALKANDGGVQFTKVMSKGMVNLARDLVPAILFTPGPDGKTAVQRYIESTYEGFGESHEQTVRSGIVARVRQADPSYANLPEFGTPAFEAEAQRAAEILPGFENVTYRDKSGQPVSRSKNFEMKLRAMARLLYGSPAQKQNVVQEAKQAVETGKRIQKDSARNKNLAKLGAGHSKGLTPAKTTGNDDLFGSPGEVNISQKLIGRLS